MRLVLVMSDGLGGADCECVRLFSAAVVTGPVDVLACYHVLMPKLSTLEPAFSMHADK